MAKWKTGGLDYSSTIRLSAWKVKMALAGHMFNTKMEDCGAERTKGSRHNDASPQAVHSIERQLAPSIPQNQLGGLDLALIPRCRPLDKTYVIVNFDALQVRIRDKSLARNNVVYRALLGQRATLELCIQRSDGGKFWL